ncbi:MAG: 50S ribosomal protein L19 [uncultured bacterium]|nr:MAG: 50S ribosomal protein L19 [uncultured bacterium]KKT02744.1 MAG: 50S ribosomal protein L19, large subunit ribosomal protein L19 [Candidatus Peregrinibacteria bacterium GW2011_GWF2_43_17]KKT20061.1 MAG: 50S ribosomal protein L19 [Candidatus Peregrinibacteria bacterium GW2011_GWA2_43_8]HAU39746.1 50S ribosomal protein L19 [Candidatus Peregrinibacteria bacterium]
MTQAILRDVQKSGLKKVPEIKAGYTVKVYQKIKEGNKERLQGFEGLVIKTNSGEGPDKTFTVRRIASGVGVEKVFPLHSPFIAKIEIIKKAKVRRAKLYYMRNKTGKAARLSETYMAREEEPVITKEETKTEVKAE